MSRNAKVLMLTLELLEFMVNNSSLPFHTQLASKDFLNTFSVMIRNKDSDAAVRDKMKHLVTAWASKFRDCQDILPGFVQLYNALVAVGIQFQNELHDTDEVYVSPKPVTAQPSSASQGLYFQAKQPAPTQSSKSLPPAKADKLKKDLQIVKENTIIVNEMIDATEYNDPNSSNEALTELIATLRAMNQKLVKLLTNLEDEEMIAYCIGIKDDVDNAIKRYEDVKFGRKPVSSSAQSQGDLLGNELFSPQNQTSGPGIRDIGIGFSQQPAPQSVTDFFGQPLNPAPRLGFNNQDSLMFNQPNSATINIQTPQFSQSNMIPSILTPQFAQPLPQVSTPQFPQPNMMSAMSTPQFAQPNMMPTMSTPQFAQPKMMASVSTPQFAQPNNQPNIYNDPFTSLNFNQSPQPGNYTNQPVYSAPPNYNSFASQSKPIQPIVPQSPYQTATPQLKSNVTPSSNQPEQSNKGAFDDLMDFAKL